MTRYGREDSENNAQDSAAQESLVNSNAPDGNVRHGRAESDHADPNGADPNSLAATTQEDHKPKVSGFHEAADKVKTFPQTPGVYLMKDAAGVVIYVFAKRLPFLGHCGLIQLQYFARVGVQHHQSQKCPHRWFASRC
mgnify:CR=1 FL=1